MPGCTVYKYEVYNTDFFGFFSNSKTDTQKIKTRWENIPRCGAGIAICSSALNTIENTSTFEESCKWSVDTYVQQHLAYILMHVNLFLFYTSDTRWCKRGQLIALSKHAYLVHLTVSTECHQLFFLKKEKQHITKSTQMALTICY